MPIAARREADPGRRQNGMRGDLPRGVEVFREQVRRHKQRFPGVGKPFAGDRVFQKSLRRPQVDAGQITNRVVVFRLSQTPHQHQPRISCTVLRVCQQVVL